MNLLVFIPIEMMYNYLKIVFSLISFHTAAGDWKRLLKVLQKFWAFQKIALNKNQDGQKWTILNYAYHSNFTYN